MSDDRTAVSSGNQSPFSSLGRVDILTSGGRAYMGTGFMIDDTHMLTAAHMVDMKGSMVSKLDFTPAMNGSSAPFGTVHAITMRPAFGYVKGLGHDDYALVTLDAPIGRVTGTFALATAKTGDIVHTAGYPDDLDSSARTMYKSDGVVTSSGKNANVSVTAFHGQSGSPIWKTGNDGKMVAVGLVDAMAAGSQPDVASSNIISAVFNSDDLKQIKLWLDQDAGRAARAPLAGYQNGVDISWYQKNNPEVALSGLSAVDHYNKIGWREGLAPNPLFDPAWYLAYNPDVAAAKINPLTHYETAGWREGRDPSPAFSTYGYENKYHDVKLAGVNPFDHYLQYGLIEGRSL